jgi:hypothetical protein
VLSQINIKMSFASFYASSGKPEAAKNDAKVNETTEKLERLSTAPSPTSSNPSPDKPNGPQATVPVIASPTSPSTASPTSSTSSGSFAVPAPVKKSDTGNKAPLGQGTIFWYWMNQLVPAFYDPGRRDRNEET